MNTLLQQPNIKDELYFHRLWNNVKQDLKHHYGEAVFKSWFSKMNIVDFTDSYIKLSAPTNFTRDWIKANYFDSIQQIWAYYDSSIKSIDIITSAIDCKNFNPKFSALQNIDANNNQQYSTKSSNNLIFSSTLDPRFTFNNFVVGRPNELAYAAATTVAESPTAVAKSNPLFLYGGVGLGKTHLMHAIAWHIQNCSLSKRKVIYMSAEKFMYQFVQSLRNKDVMSFKEQFRSVDVLMIDDIQFICGKDSTQEEFFHTFNALIDNKRQMVISCDRSPSDLDNIEERIKSRLGWGLVADVHSTTYELRLGILQSKVEQLDTSIPLKVLEFLAAKITSNVRELEGALNKVIAHATLVGYEITIENTQEILRDLLRSNQKTVTIDNIQKKVAERYNIKISDMSSSRRSRSVTRPRQLAMYLAKHLTSKSLVDIGKAFGKKDHTTVMHAIKAVENFRNQEQEFEDEVRLLMKILQS
ncbi:chromosomal replication initiator protein DnaA [Orientia chuto str. Dubai]|uniref:Chromosomal replication initiator protein DnaA n=1 Tax=Orientia chuto str. Dubai TaxID=1359168 RepID=A0A0F3MLQ3_9RICK|nr:chromosomal replication initiator protein DnaA [Candidatus Orientia mediorientalis]KJV56655.1 chromosomal replication initiator protein DnaA [Orientia chuto str. Dubai]